MGLKRGDKVKFTKIALKKISRYNPAFKKMKNIGKVVHEGHPYIQVGFQCYKWWVNYKSLELIVKNQQLLFDFMNED